MKKIFVLLFMFVACDLYAAEGVLKFGIAPGNPNSKEGLQVFMGYLAEKTGKKFEAVMEDAEPLMAGLAKGDIAFADLTSGAYAAAMANYGNKITYVATVAARNEKGALVPYYKGVFFALKSSPYKSILDLKGGSFAFVNATSTSGYIYPMATLGNLGINPGDFFKSVTFAGDHAKVFEGIKSGFLDSGVSNYDEYEKAKATYGDIFKIIGETNEIPSGAIVASSSVDRETINVVEKVLLNIKPTDPVVSYPGFLYKGFVKKGGSFYDFIKKVLKQSMEVSIPAHPYP